MVAAAVTDAELDSDLHEQRLDLALRWLVESGARSILDLGCGAGLLLKRLVREPQFERIVGIDKSSASLMMARAELGDALDAPGRRVSLVLGSFIDPSLDVQGFDAAAMIETLEHIEPRNLSRLEQAVFASYRPKRLLMTTPNSEYNVRYGLSDGELRAADHCFEWDREKFSAWGEGVARRSGYSVDFDGIGEEDAELGWPTQLAWFERRD